MPKYAPLCSDVLKVSNLRELAEAVDTLMVGKYGTQINAEKRG